MPSTTSSAYVRPGGSVRVSSTLQTNLTTIQSPQAEQALVGPSFKTGILDVVTTITDAGSSTWVLVQTSAEAKADVGADTYILVQSSFEAKADSGSDVMALIQSALEAKADTGSDTFTLTQAALEAKADGGSDIIILTQAGADALADQLTEVITLIQLGAIGGDVPDSGTDVWLIADSGVYRITDAGPAFVNVGDFGEQNRTSIPF